MTETSTIMVTVSDDARFVITDTAIVLVAEDDQYLDLNGDGCNTIEDLWALAELWRQFIADDPNGDGIVDVLDFLYINTEETNCLDP